MVAQVAAILILILGQGHLRGLTVLGQVALWIATVAAIVSAVGYARKINVLMGMQPVAAATQPDAAPVTPITADPTSRESSQPPRRASA
jgi:hypothetical protein